MEEDPRLFEVFLDVQRGLPRQGPGSDESTNQAVSLCRGLPNNPVILDIGCGPGMQTVALAQALSGSITAVDIYQEYLDQLKERVQSRGVAESIEILVADINDLPFPHQSFDLIWSEGAAYNMGFENALVDWRRFLKSGGCLAVTELVWLRHDPPAPVFGFFENEYPAMTTVENNLETIRNSGYEPLAHFTLPDSAWWEHYYGPLEEKLPALYEKYSDDADALNVIESTKSEIEMRRLYPDWYGYEFFISQKVG